MRASSTPDPIDPASTDDRSLTAVGPAGPLRRFSRRYWMVLLAVAGLVIVDEAIIQPQLVRLNFYAPAINVAGRQRMLSQKITKYALALAADLDGDQREDRREQLLLALDEWNAAHRGLLDGSEPLGLEPIADQPTRAELIRLEPSFETIRASAQHIAKQVPGRSPVAAQRQADLDQILANEPQYLERMERVVRMLEEAAGRRVTMLRWCGLATMLAVLGLLISVFFVVLQPALNLIRDQITRLADSESRHRVLAALLGEARDELESRVATRTRELVEANRALQSEIAERATAQKRMRELSAALAHASRVTALGQLATGLAHEINQPLASITNYADTLEVWAENGSLDTAAATSTVSQLKRAALRAGQIVRRMRNFVRREGSPAGVVELNALVLEVCELCRPQLDHAQVRLSVDATPGEILVLADSLEIQQVLVNLVQNAAQALATCAREVRQIEILTRIEPGLAAVEVLDNGPGFLRDSAEDCFAPFFSTKADGLGMGLSISRTLLERHHGQLWGKSRPGGGAVVGFQLPLASQHELSASRSADCLYR